RLQWLTFMAQFSPMPSNPRGAAFVPAGPASTLEQVGGDVALAGVGEEYDDRLAREGGEGGERKGGVQGSAGGDAGDDALLAGKAAGAREGILIGDGDHLVDDRAVQDGGNEPDTDAGHLVGAGRPAGQDRRPRGFDGDDAG